MSDEAKVVSGSVSFAARPALAEKERTERGQRALEREEMTKMKTKTKKGKAKGKGKALLGAVWWCQPLSLSSFCLSSWGPLWVCSRRLWSGTASCLCVADGRAASWKVVSMAEGKKRMRDDGLKSN